MLEKIEMPAMGATMEEGTIVAWKVKEGQSVQTGEVLLELETDKTSYEFESPHQGIVRKILVNEGETVPIHQIIAIIGDEDEEIPAKWIGTQKVENSDTTQQKKEISVKPISVNTSSINKGIKISPKARKLADKLSVDISCIQGTGPDGRIESSDVETAAVHIKNSGLIPITTTRKKINTMVIQSKQQIPHFYMQTMVDMTNAVSYRDKLSEKGEKISYNVLLAKAVVAGLESEPSLNYTISDKGYIPGENINIGLAIETPKGVIVAVIDDIDKLDIPEISQKMQMSIEAVRQGRNKDIKMEGASLTISNIGMYNVDIFMPIIHPGESAIIGIGRITERVLVKNGQVVIYKSMSVSICIDHRIADGAVAARFLDAFVNYLENI